MALLHRMPEESNAATSGWVSAPNIRGTDDILWTCFFTVFVCTWTVLHLNLPAPGESFWRFLVRKARWMTMAVIVPEVVTCTAFVQRVAARNSKELFAKADDSHEMSLCHGFYFNMGGMVIKPLDGDVFPVNARLLDRLIQAGLIHHPGISAEEIWDRSKTDRFAKICACLQIAWLAIQSTGRVADSLAVTPLEVTTLGFAVPSLASFCFWFYKPVDIRTPTTISINMTTVEMMSKLKLTQTNWSETPLEGLAKVNKPSFTSELILKSRFWPKQARFRGPAVRIRNDVFELKYTILDQLAVAVSWVGYAGTHFSAWRFKFPTRAELLMWRASCVVMAGSMLVFWLTSNRKIYLLFAACAWKRKHKDNLKKVAYERQKISAIQIATGTFGAFLYLNARLILLTLALTSLRALPQTAYQTVDWSNLLPHFG